METAEIILLTVFIGLIVFLIGIYIGVAVAMEQDEKKKKERWRKTEAYKLGLEEEKEATQKSSTTSSLVELNNNEIKRLKNKENLSVEELEKLVNISKYELKKIESEFKKIQIDYEIYKTLNEKGGDESVQQSDIS